jgi:MFS family permease
VKLFCLTGFGYAADSLILLLQSITAVSAAAEFHPFFKNGLTIAVYVGMLVGALFWGLGADIIGRRIAFNTSLFICSALLSSLGPHQTGLCSACSLVSLHSVPEATWYWTPLCFLNTSQATNSGS